MQVSTWRLAAEQAASVAERAQQQVEVVERRLNEGASNARAAAAELEARQMEVVHTRQMLQSSNELMCKRYGLLADFFSVGK